MSYLRSRCDLKKKLLETYLLKRQILIIYEVNLKRLTHTLSGKTIQI